MSQERLNLEFDALRNAIYHSARREFFDAANRWLSFVVVAGGSSAVASLIGDFVIIAKFSATISAVAGLLQLVFDFGGKARTHEFLQKRFYELLAEIEEIREPSEGQIDSWVGKLHRIYADEPPQKRALDAIAYNAALEALGRDPQYRVPITFMQSLFSQFRSFHEINFNPFHTGENKTTKVGGA